MSMLHLHICVCYTVGVSKLSFYVCVLIKIGAVKEKKWLHPQIG